MHPSHFRLETYRLGEGEAHERLEIEAHLQGCDHCRLIIQRMEAHAQQHRLSHDPVTMSVALLGRAQQRTNSQKRRRVWSSLVGLGSVAAVAMMILLFVPWPWNSAIPDSTVETGVEARVKGNLIVHPLLQTADGPLKTTRDHVYSAGDRIFLSIRSPRDGFITVFTDGALLFTSTAVKAGQETLLPSSIEVEGPSQGASIEVILTDQVITTRPRLEQNLILGAKEIEINWK